MGCLQMPQGTGDLFAVEAPVQGLWSFVVSIDVIQESWAFWEWGDGLNLLVALIFSVKDHSCS